MPLDLKTLDGTAWLAEPAQLRLTVARVAQIPTCPTAREVAAEHRTRLDDARRAPERAVPAGGADHPEEQVAARPIRAVRGKVGVIPIHGMIGQRASAALLKAGGTSTEEVSASLDALLAAPDVESIVLHIDSPGGTSYGVEELADKIHAARGRKRTYAAVDSMGASAAYWLATAAETVVLTPGGDVGSVGVYVVHVDESKALEQEGLSITVVQAGKYKTETSSHTPLSADAKAYLQDHVDRTYDRFVTALARHRGKGKDEVRRQFGEGRLVPAGKAIEAGMVDRVMTFETLLSRLTGQGGTNDSRRASADALRLRHELARARFHATQV